MALAAGTKLGPYEITGALGAGGTGEVYRARDTLAAGFPNTFVNYDVSPDGQPFLMIKDTEQQSALMQINVVLNWFEELKQKVPTGKK